jgi:hypothetical protein
MAGSTLCRDLDEIKFSARRKQIAKQEGEKGLAAFNRWIMEQANGWCSVGLCAQGDCKGHLKGTQVRLLAETDEHVEVRFSTTIYCACDSVASAPGTPPATTPGGGAGSAPGTGGCPCSVADEDAELASMLAHYADGVNSARANGYQAANDAGYSDPGLGFHNVGNCADWRHVSWSALVTRTWQCWQVEKIRAWRPLLQFHHFVKITARCSGRVFYLDPWQTGNPDHWPAATFPFLSGWSHTTTHTHAPDDPPRDPGND